MSEVTQPQKAASAKPKGLGRGLGSLLGQTDEGAFARMTNTSAPAPVSKAPLEKTEVVAAAPAVPAHLRVWQIPIEKIEPNPDQPRQVFASEPLEELAKSIREKGIIQPILVRKKNDGFEIIAGERRWRAAQIAGLKEVPALLKDYEDQEVLELALIENIQRENLNAIEEAEAYEFLIKKYNITQQEVATKVGKDRATVANLLRLLNLQPTVRQMVSNKELSLGQAKVLLSIDEAKLQESLAHRAVSENLSVRALEKLLSKVQAAEPAPLSDVEDLRVRTAKSLGEELQKILGSKVTMEYAQGRGKLSLQFYSDQELNQLVDRLRAACQT